MVNINISFKKIHSSLILTFLSFFFILKSAYSESTKIGSITELSGNVISINKQNEERELAIFDNIFLKDEIFIGKNSSATIQFDDNTTIILKEFTSLNISEFENSGGKDKFKAKVGKGKIIIESGSIAKNPNGEMFIDLSNMSLGIRGTRLNANIKPNGNSEVALAEDSFGKVGEIEVSSEGQNTSLSTIDQVIEITGSKEIIQREQSEIEKQELISVNTSLVKVSKIDENELTEQLQEKLAKGNLQDANNDGVVDEIDIEAAKEIIKEDKKQKIDFIVENSNDDNTTFLSNVIDQSDNQNIGETIEKIIETKDTLVESIVGNLSDKNNEFITTLTSESAGFIKEKIFETIVAKETTKSAEVLSKVMAKSDQATVISVINNITEKNINEESTLSLKVMADFSKKNPEKLENLSEIITEDVQKLTVDAVKKASSSNEDVDLIAQVVSFVNNDIVNIVVEEVSKSSTEEKQSLSAKVFKAIIDTEPDKMEIISDDIRDIMIQQTVESAKNQQEGTFVEEENLADIVASIIVNTNKEIASQFIEEVNDIETDTNLSLEVISGISEKDSGRIDTLSEFNKEQMDQLTIDAVQKAENTSEDSKLIAKVVSVVSDELVNVMIEEVSKTSTDEKQTLSAKVLQAIVDTEPDKIDIIDDEIKDTMIQQTIESAKNQEEGTVVQEQEDFTDIVSDIIVKTDTETATKIIEEVNNTDTETNLSLKVIAGISEKDYTILDFISLENKNNIDKLTENAIKNAKNTFEDSELIASVVSNVSEGLANQVVEEVSKTSTDEKQTLSAKVLKAIVDTEPDKIDIIDDEIKDTMIQQTIESAKNQQEGTGIEEETDLTSIVSDIIVKTDTETATKIIEEVNNTDTETNLSLKVISGISEKDSAKLETLSQNNKETIDELTENAVENAENTKEDSELIAKVVSVASDDLANKVVQEVSKNATEEKQTLSVKVLKAIVETTPEKINDLDAETKDEIIDKAVETAKQQSEGKLEGNEDATNDVANIIVNADKDTANEVLEKINNTETDSNLSLDVFSDLTKQENFDEKLDTLSDEAVNNMIAKAVDKADKDDTDTISDILQNSETSITSKIIDTATNSKESKNVVNDALVNVAKKDPDKVKEILEESEKDTNTTQTTTNTNQNKKELYDTEGFSLTSPYHHKDTGTPYNPSGFDKDGNSENQNTQQYDAGGFSLTSPYHHKDTGTPYNAAGFDKDGNSENQNTQQYDAGGFSLTSPYHHKDTGTPYNAAGFDKDGNINPASGSDPTWITKPNFNASYTTADTISTSASATSSPASNGIEYSASNLPPGVDIMTGSGLISGKPTTAGTYSGTITATDKVNTARKTTSSFNFIVTDAASDPSWVTKPTFNASYTTADTISTSASATSSPASNGIEYSASDLPPGVDIMTDSGLISGKPTTVGTFSVIVTATDLTDATKKISTASFGITITDAYNARGFSLTAPFYHKDTGTLYDLDGYNDAGFNNQGYNEAGDYNELYDEDASPS